MDLTSSAEGQQAEIALVYPPFASISMPSIQLGLLKALCTREGMPVDDFYFNVDFARTIGVPLYSSVTWFTGPQLGEWLFGASAFGDEVPAQPYVERFRDLLASMARGTGCSISDLVDLRQNRIPRLVSGAARVLARYRIVGFSSTFQQNVAALALARATKALRPDVDIVFGGSNMHGVMGEEFFRAFDFLDHVATGEADHLVVPLFRSILDRDRSATFGGILSRQGADGQKADSGGASADASYPMYAGNMDSLPVPDYASYFAALRRGGFTESSLGYPISIPFESSRGCWWGQKHHCTFCGLNTVGMAFRAKSPARVAEEIQTLQRAHGVDRFDATDNIIAHDGDGALLGRLSDLPRKVDLFYEIKSNIGPKEAARLAAAGVKRVQPGVESFSSRVLKIMDKGVGGLHNVNALRWLSTFGVSPLYNILYGFPGEELDDYEYQRELVGKITHLPPPSSVGRIRLDRFSPNFERPELRARFHDVRPAESYGYVYPVTVDLDRAAYHFEGAGDQAATADKLQAFFREVDAWKASWGQGRYVTLPFQAPPPTRPRLEYRRLAGGGGLVLDGRRRPTSPEKVPLARTATSLLEALLFRPTPIASVTQKVAREGHREDEVLQELAGLQARGLVLVENKLALALPVLDATDGLTREHLHEPAARPPARVALPVL
jgi:ribosomal peptide maturation radical SAM protein 1